MSALKIFGYGALAIVGIGGLAVVGSVVGGLTSVATAPGRVVSKTMDTNNIIASYEFFHDANNQFIARVAQVRNFKKLAAEPSDSMEKNRLRIELSAIQQSCRDLAGKYNSNAAKVNKSIFRGGSAPESLNIAECE